MNYRNFVKTHGILSKHIQIMDIAIFAVKFCTFDSNIFLFQNLPLNNHVCTFIDVLILRISHEAYRCISRRADFRISLKETGF